MVALLLAGLAPRAAATPKQMQISFGGYTNRSQTLTNFPVLVVFSNNAGGNFTYGDFLSGSGLDLRFATNSTSTAWLNYEIEAWNSNGASYIWVQVPAIPPDGSGSIWAGWGNSASSSRLPCTTNGTTWDANYRGVWHLASTALTNDSTANRYNGSNSGATATNGTVAGAAYFNGASLITVGNLGATPTGYMLECWSRRPALGGSYYVFLTPAPTYFAALWAYENGNIGFGDANGSWSAWSSVWTDKTAFHHIAVNAASGTGSLYFDGVSKGNISVCITGAWSNCRIGGAWTYFTGLMDEVRISDTTRSTNWIWASCQTIASNTTFNRYGAMGAPAWLYAENASATAVSTAGATFNGTLVSTGAAACAVGVYWGTSDGGTNASAWANTNWFNDGAVNAAWTNGTAFSTNISLAANQTYYYTYVASNASGIAVVSPSVALITADVTLRATDASASWVAGDTGVFSVVRGADVTNAALVVNYSIGGTGANGTDYTTIGGSVTIPAGQTNATVAIAPIANPPGGGTRTVILSLASGGYTMGTPSSDTVSILRQARTIYVATNGTNDAANSFNTWAGAATNIHAAVAVAGAYDSVLVSNGLYQLTNQLVVGAGFTLQGVNGVSNTFLRANGSAGGFRVIYLTNANAVVDGLTLTNGYSTGAHGGGIYMTTGTVQNCAIWGCGSPAAGSYSGGGVYMTGGVLTGSTIRACTSGSAAGIYASGGTVVDCTIRDNICSFTDSSYLTAPATMSNCRIFGNSSAYYSGGISVYGGATIQGCLVYSNVLSAQSADPNYTGATGGGIALWNGVAINCVMYGNSARDGGGIGTINGGRIVNCTVANNTAQRRGGGVFLRNGNIGAVTNTIVHGNLRDGMVENYSGDLSAAAYSCAPELTNSAAGNITAAPEFVNAAAGDYRPQFYSPCVDTGTNLASVATDCAGAARPMVGNGFGQLRHDMGAYEINAPNGALQVSAGGAPASGLAPLQSVLTATVGGSNTTITWYGWDFTNGGAFNQSGSGLGVVTNTYGAGTWSVRLSVSNSAGESATVVWTNLIVVIATNIYVSSAGLSQLPYSTWATAATNVKDAVSAALGGCTIWVTNGAYAVPSPVNLSVAATLRSVNGTNATSLYRPSSGTNRLLNLAHASAVVQGLTLSNGLSSTFCGGLYMMAGTVRDCVITNCGSQGAQTAGNGGGVYMENGLITNVLIAGCWTSASGEPAAAGGGIYMSGGSMRNSAIRGCTGWNAPGIHAAGGTVEDCAIQENISSYINGNGVSGATFRRCRIFRNQAVHYNGGVSLSGGTLENCLIYSNGMSATAAYAGGGILMTAGTIDNCTIANNQITSAGSAGAGGLRQSGGTVRNTIIHGNKQYATDNNYTNAAGGTIVFSLAPELATGAPNYNLNGNPQFTDAAAFDYSLQTGSPCQDTGTNLTWTVNDLDLAGNSRLYNDTVDMGCYELQPPPGGTMFLFL